MGGDNKLEEVYVKNTDTGAEDILTPDGLFVFIGQQSNTAFLRESGIQLDDYGFILTVQHPEHHPAWPANNGRRGVLETSLPGVFAAGDVRTGSTKQVTSAVGEGATAALLIRAHFSNS